MQMPNLELGFQIDFVIVFRPQTIARLRPVLTHHDDRRLHSGQTGENQVEENEWIWVEGACREDNAVEGDGRIYSATIPVLGDFVFLQTSQINSAVTVLLMGIRR